MGAAILLPLQLEDVAGFDPARAGRWLAIPPVAALFFAPLAGRWADRFGTRPLAVLGLLIAATGAGLLANLGLENRGLAVGAALFGVGLGLFTAPNASAVLGAVGRERLSAAAGLQATARNLGVSLGAAGASASVTLLAGSAAHPAAAAHPANLARAIGFTFAGLAVLAGVGAGLAAVSRVGRPAARTGS
jgi:MFS family permease